MNTGLSNPISYQQPSTLTGEAQVLRGTVWSGWLRSALLGWG